MDKEQNILRYILEADLIAKDLPDLKERYIETINHLIKALDERDECYGKLRHAKSMEKRAHQETWDVAHQAGRFEGKGIAEENWQTFEEYWEENFKQREK
jgi:hypothetical protein